MSKEKIHIYYALLIHSADPQSRLVVIIVFAYVVCPSPLFKIKQNNFKRKQCSLLARLRVWPSGSLMTPVLFSTYSHVYVLHYYLRECLPSGIASFFCRRKKSQRILDEILCIVSFGVYCFFELSRSNNFQVLHIHSVQTFDTTSMYHVCDKYIKNSTPQDTVHKISAIESSTDYTH